MPYALLFALLLRSWAGARLVNITIDDFFGDHSSGRNISYFPPEVWQSSITCQNCAARLDLNDLFKNTWTESTFYSTTTGLTNMTLVNVTLSATIFFNGSAVFVNCVLARTKQDPVGDSDLSFYIDGRLVGNFFKRAPGLSGYDYNVTVFAETSLSPGEHNLTIQNGHVNGIKSFILLDSIVYTQDDGLIEEGTTSPISPTSPSPTTSNSDTAASAIGGKPSFIVPIVASVCGIIVLTIVGMLLYSRWRRQADLNRLRETVEPWIPFVHDSVPGDPLTAHAHVDSATRVSSIPNGTITDMPPPYEEQVGESRRVPAVQKQCPGATAALTLSEWQARPDPFRP